MPITVEHTFVDTQPDDGSGLIGPNQWNGTGAHTVSGSVSGSLEVTDGTTDIPTATIITAAPGAVTDLGGGNAGVLVNVGTTPDAPLALAPADYILSNTLDTIPAFTYDDGTGGVGATLTENDPTDGALSADGASPSVGQRIVFNDGPGPHPGIYVVTDPGDGATAPWVLTRATDCDTPTKRCIYWSVGVLAGTQFTEGTARITWFLLGAGVISVVVAGQYGGAAFGFGTSASGVYSTAWGQGGNASGRDSIAGGHGAIASGINSTAIGDGAIASGDRSVAFSGSQSPGANSLAVGGSVAAGERSLASGLNSDAYGYGQRAHSSNSSGYQTSDQTYDGRTADDTPLVLLDGSGGSLTLPDFAHTCIVRGRIVGRRTDVPGTDSAWDFAAVIRGDGTSAYSWVGGSDPVPAIIYQDSGASAWVVAATIDTASIVITVTGDDAKTIDWMSTIELDEVV